MAILAEDGDAVAMANPPRMQGVGGAGDALGEFARADRKPFARVAVEHDAIEIAFDGGEEDVVEGGDGHCVVRVPDC